ncbi:hypothetical protein DSL64_03570 [Dyadobacter luteus]|uniref:Luciferase-like domain-containing protein n=1 Tax=Dyadobacter luteus TaxID=2259619 RepID=A0A3D8YFT5_9BACT|nr:LLM class flavin-dependent oxidoreductase [Dyadobacter luteus]REA63535.1 hypothetical protein DSL64_03570 [Dyadobacter luteus]
MKNVKFGLIDFGLRGGTTNSLRILSDLVEYAQYADELGFSRIWLAEHYYSHKTHAWTSPEPLVGVLAAATERIRIGTAGILLSIHQPFHIAAKFKLLNNLFSDRIDLGLANGLVGEKIREYALDDPSCDIKGAFDKALDKLLFFLREEDEIFNSGEGIVLPPYKASIPELWSMGTSLNGLGRTLTREMNFSRSLFHKGADKSPNKEQLQEYNAAYRSAFGYAPKVNLAISGICNDGQNRENQYELAQEGSENCIIGCPSLFYDKIAAYQEDFGVDEFIFMDLSTSHNDRLKSLERIQTLFG